MALATVRGVGFATLCRGTLVGMTRSLHASCVRKYQSDKQYPHRGEARPEDQDPYPGSYVEFKPEYYVGDGLRKVQPPDWDGFSYIDKKGWFHEWLVGRPSMDKGAHFHVSGYPNSVREYREWEELINEARDRYFGSYPPKGLDEDYRVRMVDFALKYDKEALVEMTFVNFEHYHMKTSPQNYAEVKARVDEYRSVKRQERWDAW